MKRTIRIAILGMGMLAVAAFAQSANDPITPEASRRLAAQVRHELVMMPWYGIFDHIAFRMDGCAVTLIGEVVRPTLRDEAERRVRALEGIGPVDNQIRVLPLSTHDDRIRLASWRAIYLHPVFSRYSLGAFPSLHLVVENGAVTLKGVVATEMERNLAGILANGLPGVFAVKNELVVEKAAPKSRRS